MCGGEKFEEKEIVKTNTNYAQNYSNDGPSLFDVIGKLTVPAVCQEEETMNVIPKEKQESIKSEIEAGTGIRKIAGKVGVSRNTVKKYIREEKKAMAEKAKCSFEGCEKFAHIKGLCDRHYRATFGGIYKPGTTRGQYKQKETKPTIDPIEQIATDFKARMELLLADFRKEAEKWKKAVEALEAVLKDVV